MRRLFAFGLILAGLASGCGDTPHVGAEASAEASTASLPPERVALEAGTLLVARERLGDSNFARTVILLLHYGPKGAMGVVVNRPTAVDLGSLVPEFAGMDGGSPLVHYGGPVQPGKLTFLGDARAARGESPEICTGVHRLSNAAVAADTLERDHVMRAYAGYAGWAPGQLDYELDRGDWFVVACDAGNVFAEPAHALWPRLIDWLTAPAI